MGVGAVLFISLVGLIILQVPVGIAVGAASFLAALYGGLSDVFVVQALVQGVDTFPIMAIPLFIFAGELMGAGGVSKRMLNVAKLFVGRVSGGLGIVTVIVGMFFATVSGSGPATVAAVGSMVVPTMIENGYSKSFTLSLIATTGAIGVIIPPSIPMVIFGVTTGVSISDMFLGGILPGIIVGVLLMIYCYMYGRKHSLRSQVKTTTTKEKFKTVWDAKWALLNPVIVLGGIYGGIFTPTEAAAVGVAYAFICGVFIYKELNRVAVVDVIKNSCLTIGAVMVIMGGATAFARILMLEQIPAQIAGFMAGLTDNVFVMILLINLFLLIVGLVMDTLPAIMILAPILLPIAVSVGINPVQFGIIMIVNKAVSFLTPPLGINLLVAARVGNTGLDTVIKGIAPFILTMIIVLLIISFFPWLSLVFIN